MLVSVLMPVFNREKYISIAIQSILKQTWKDFRFIIYDDGSTDSTSQILSNYAKKDPRILIINNSKNIGVAHARNCLVAACKTKYAAWQDSDDISNIHRLKEQVTFLEKQTNLNQIIYTQKDIIKAEEEPNWKSFPEVQNPPVGKLAFPTTMFKVEKILQFDEKIKVGGSDANWIRSLVNLGWEKVLLPKVLYYYRFHKDRIGSWKRKIAVSCSKEDIKSHSYEELIKLCRRVSK